MRGKNWQQIATKGFWLSLMAAILLLGTSACGDRTSTSPGLGFGSPSGTGSGSSLAEVSPPAALQQLRQSLETYQPQVKILSPQPEEVLTDTTVSVRFQVQDLPLFKDPKFDLGPHLHVILDNQPYQAVYDANQPLTFEDLSPGTHTIRAFASRPWHESFKNEGAYAQTTFHIFAKTQDNDPDAKLPLLTYSRPKGSYGAEPIMLDFYLTNAPLHLVAQENPSDEIRDWKIRATVNGESFIIDQWQPLYLKGFKSGTNWVQLELLDELGNPIDNEFNNTIRLITYDPKGKDALSQLTRGDLSAEEARSIVDPNYTAPSGTRSPSPEIPPVVTPEPSVPSETTQPESPFNRFRRTQPVEEAPTPEPVLEPTPSVEVSPEPEPTPPAVEAPEPAAKGKSEGIFSRFRKQKAEEVTPTPEELPATPSLEPEVQPTPLETPVPEVFPSPSAEPTTAPAEPSKPENIFSRFRRQKAVTPAPSSSPALPEIPSTLEPEVQPTPIETPVPEVSPTPSAEPTPAPVETAKPENALSRLRRLKSDRPLVPTPSPVPTLPEIVDAPKSAPTELPSPAETPAAEVQPEVPEPASSPDLPIIQATPPAVPSRYLPQEETVEPITPTETEIAP